MIPFVLPAAPSPQPPAPRPATEPVADPKMNPETAEVPVLLAGVPESASFPAVLLALAGASPPAEPVAVSTYTLVGHVVVEHVSDLATPPEADHEVADGVAIPSLYLSADLDREVAPVHEAAEHVVEAEALEEEGRGVYPDSPLADPTVAVLVPVDESGAVAFAASAAAADTVTLAPEMLTRLARDFVVRLERVADRMWTDHGMRIEVVEGYRSQARQDDLFAQGRTAPGPVVTWTTRSLHTIGAAADIYVNGAPIGPEQAAILARVANEEGLRTLYPFDSGHIQLDRPNFAAEMEAPLNRPSTPAQTAAPEVERGVARVAPVAPVARPARPSGSDGLPEAKAPDPRPFDPSLVEAYPVKDGPTPEAAASARLDRGQTGGRFAQLGSPAPSGTPEPRAASQALSQTGLSMPERPSEGDVTAGIDGSDGGSERLPTWSAPAATPTSSRVGATPVARLEAMDAPMPVDPTRFEATTPRVSFHRLHLPIDGVQGASSIDVGLRGGVVDGWLNVTDPALAADLRRSLHDLKQTLGERGLEARALGVRVVAGGVEAAGAGSESAGGRTAGDGSFSQEAEAERQRSNRERASRDARERSTNNDPQGTKEEA